MPQAESVWAAISSCWSAEIFMPDLAHRFWRLTLQVRTVRPLRFNVRRNALQLLSRYKIWLETVLPQSEAQVQATSPTDKVVGFVPYDIRLMDLVDLYYRVVRLPHKHLPKHSQRIML